jgi:hypothetical protein
MAFVQLRQIPLVASAVICAALFGGYLIWNPDHATSVAHLFGIGRGTDLVLYVWMLISFALMLVLYFNSRKQFQIVTVLVRAIALAEARLDSEMSEETDGPAKQTHATR